ncbi:hypothetical protein SteCoe_24092 [Stentor coeruleus]|uniref:Uncharacterized protein n=1 Tax=Stentor coeruleus TaxID=5963 RepID=A0A1R2BIB2_9CILI|nr:hypothetical protein SteCoe_24092 [Stentor coeruleus]
MEKPYSSSTDPNSNYQNKPSEIQYSSPPYSTQQNYAQPPYNQPQIYPPPNYPAYAPQNAGPPGQYAGPPGQYIGPPGQYAGPPGQYVGPSGQYVGPPGQYVGPQQAYVQTTQVMQFGIQSAVVVPTTVIIPTMNITANVEYSERERKRGRFSNKIRYLILVKLIADILLALSIAPLFLLALQAVFGYFGAKHMNKCLCIFYLIFLVIIFIIRIGLMFLVPLIFVIIVFSLLCIFDIVVFVFYVKFTHMIIKMHEHERARVMSYLLLMRSGRCCYI